MFAYIKAWLETHLAKETKGQDLAEYALLIGLIALAVFVAVMLLGTNLSQLFQGIADQVGNWVTQIGG